MERPIVCLKIGGTSITNDSTLDLLIDEIAELSSIYKFAIVHGGGAEVSELSRFFGIDPVFENGVRMTSDGEMEIVDMVLCGKVNKYLIRKLFSRGIGAVGLSGSDGGVVIGTSVGGGSRTGKVSSVNKCLIELLIHDGWTPVIASTSMDRNGFPLNINADEVALAIASGLPAGVLVFISDIRGVLKQGKVISRINPCQVKKEINSGIINGGMIPKVLSSIRALDDGVNSVIIGGYKNRGDLELLIGGSLGTKIFKEK